MKIAFLSGNLTDGGAQRVISIVASGLAEKGHEVYVVLFSRNEKEYPLNEKIRLIALGDSFEEYSKMSGLERIFKIRKLLKNIKPDVAIGFLEGGYALYLSSFGMNFAKVASARIDPQMIFNKKGLRAMINRKWFLSADRVVLQTKKQSVRVPNKLRKKCVVIGNPVQDRALENRVEVRDECNKIVMVGRLAKQKNYPMVFDAILNVIKINKNIHLSIYGKGGEEKELSMLIQEKELQDYVSLCGWTQDTIEELKKHDMYILSSNYEGMPNALMEAMAVGLPCISTNCDTGPEDLIKDGSSGFLIPVGDVEMLSERIIHIMCMPKEQRSKMGALAHECVLNEFSCDNIVKKWENMLEEIVQEKNS